MKAIEIDGVSKRYFLGEDRPGRTLRDALTSSFRRVRGTRSPRDEIWSLRDVNLTVDEGDAIGIIGRNGAGKSTLLRILTRITEPTAGRSRTRGRVASLLEIGTGFHPELTGRENVYLNGAILGMGRREIDRRLDEIMDFAGVEAFADTPVKRYSSGMYLRLAFSVAAYLEPDILVVDEVLAVGDAEFQAKCLNRMDLSEREGRTVVFVSHNLDAIARLCPRALWLERGQVVRDGSSDDVIDAYVTGQSQSNLAARRASIARGPVHLLDVRVVDVSGKEVQVMRHDQPFAIEIHFRVLAPTPGLDIATFMTNMRNVEVLNEALSDSEERRPSEPGDYVARAEIPPILAPGEYVVGVWLGTAYEVFVQELITRQLRLQGDASRAKRVMALGLPWSLERVSDPGNRAQSQ
jgi:ABC-type polysaccharide/polyol phosphate transport system ATPase subunit